MRKTAIIIAAFLIPNTASSKLIDIGAAGAITGKVTAKAPETDSGDRALSSGKTVYFKDSVTTDEQGHAQVLLLDETVFTIGKNSNIILDDFVYDPFTDAGKVTAKVTKGVLRFVTGKVGRKNPSSMKIKLPSGTLGIRGTIAAVQTDGNRTIAGLLGPGTHNNADERPGAIWVENAGKKVQITRPGFGTIIEGPGMPPSPPFELTPDQLVMLNTTRGSKGSDLRDSPGSGDKNGASGKDSASKVSGQTTAEGKGALAENASITDFGGLLDDANEDIDDQTAIGTLPGTQLQWDEVRTIESGTGYYSGEGDYTCSGYYTTGGAFDFIIDVDFGNRTLGGGRSNISILTGDLSQTQTNVGTVSFNELEGAATLTLGTAVDTSFADTTVTLLANSSIADQMRVDLNYDDGYSTAVGSATGDYQESVPFGGDSESIMP